MTATSLAENRRQVCDDRVALTRWRFRVTSFAYPFGNNDATSQQVVRECGYTSGTVEPAVTSSAGRSGVTARLERRLGDHRDRVPGADGDRRETDDLRPGPLPTGATVTLQGG